MRRRVAAFTRRAAQRTRSLADGPEGLRIHDTRPGTYTTELNTGQKVSSTISELPIARTLSDWHLLVEDWQPGSTATETNNYVRVTEWRFERGAATGWHRHDYDYVVVPLTTGPLVLDERDGKRVVQLMTGVPYFREAGVEHDVANGTDGEFVFVEVEVKRPRAR